MGRVQHVASSLNSILKQRHVNKSSFKEECLKCVSASCFHQIQTFSTAPSKSQAWINSKHSLFSHSAYGNSATPGSTKREWHFFQAQHISFARHHDSKPALIYNQNSWGTCGDLGRMNYCALTSLNENRADDGEREDPRPQSMSLELRRARTLNDFQSVWDCYGDTVRTFQLCDMLSALIFLEVSYEELKDYVSLMATIAEKLAEKAESNSPRQLVRITDILTFAYGLQCVKLVHPDTHPFLGAVRRYVEVTAEVLPVADIDNLSEISPHHFVNLFRNLVRLPSEVLVDNKLRDAMTDVITVIASSCNSRQIAVLTWILAKLRYVQHSALVALCSRAEIVLPVMLTKHLIIFIPALGSLQRQGEHLTKDSFTSRSEHFRQLEFDSDDEGEGQDGVGANDTYVAATQFREFVSSIFYKLGHLCESNTAAAAPVTWTPHDLAQISAAMAVARVSPTPLVQVVLDTAQRLLPHMTFQQVATVLWSMAHKQKQAGFSLVRTPEHQRLWTRALKVLPEYYAFAARTIDPSEGDVLDEPDDIVDDSSRLFRPRRRQSRRSYKEREGLPLVWLDVVWACASMGVYDAAVFNAAGAAIGPVIDQLSLQQLGIVLHAFAVVGHVDDDLLRALSNAVSEHCRFPQEWTAQQIGKCAWALAVMSFISSRRLKAAQAAAEAAAPSTEHAQIEGAGAAAAVAEEQLAEGQANEEPTEGTDETQSPVRRGRKRRSLPSSQSDDALDAAAAALRASGEPWAFALATLNQLSDVISQHNPYAFKTLQSNQILAAEAYAQDSNICTMNIDGRVREALVRQARPPMIGNSSAEFALVRTLANTFRAHQGVQSVSRHDALSRAGLGYQNPDILIVLEDGWRLGVLLKGLGSGLWPTGEPGGEYQLRLELIRGTVDEIVEIDEREWGKLNEYSEQEAFVGRMLGMLGK